MQFYSQPSQLASNHLHNGLPQGEVAHGLATCTTLFSKFPMFFSVFAALLASTVLYLIGSALRDPSGDHPGITARGICTPEHRSMQLCEAALAQLHKVKHCRKSP